MQAKNLLKIMPIRLYKMDKKSNRYRVCPNDGEEFMANDRREVHCCPECADEYSNEKKRLAKLEQQQSLIETEIVLNDSIQQIDNEEKNLQILDQLDVKDNGSKFNMDFLSSIGFDFFSYAEKEALYNIDPQLNCHYVQIGAYRLFRVEITEVLIKKIK
jgi:uncharacterized Zn ribbon protein